MKNRRRCAPPFSCYPRKPARGVFKHPPQQGEGKQKHWSMIIHHVCGDHGLGHVDGGEAVLSQYLHGKLSAEEQRKTARQLKKGEPAFVAMRDLVLGKKNLARVDGVLRYRHTGSIENYHSMSLSYTPKRVYYEQVCLFADFKCLSAICRGCVLITVTWGRCQNVTLFDTCHATRNTCCCGHL